MIASLSGVVKAVTADAAIVDVGGIGFRVLLSARTLAALPPVGQSVELLTYMQVSDAGVTLFGFGSEEEKTLFEQLIVVHGIGPKGALGALSALDPSELVRAIVDEDVAALTHIPGVGKKTATRIVVELKSALTDALADYPELLTAAGAESSKGAPAADEGRNDEALDALRSMGFTDTEVSLALKGAPADADEVALIQYALKRLGSG